MGKLLDGDEMESALPGAAAATRDEYARRATSGGMPVALRRPPGRSRSRWFANYVDLVVDKDVSWSDAPVAVGYFRTESGDEVDLVLERDDGQVIAFEIKAGTRVRGEDLRGLRLLRDRLGSRLQEEIWT